jgi:hypothetical protein
MVEPVGVPDEVEAGQRREARPAPVERARAFARRAPAEGKRQEDERDEEEEVDRPLDPRLEDAVAGGVEMEEGGRGRPGPGAPANATS